MDKLKIGITLIILGNLLYLLRTVLFKNTTSRFQDFLNGLLLGLSVGVNIIGIIVLVLYTKEIK